LRSCPVYMHLISLFLPLHSIVAPSLIPRLSQFPFHSFIPYPLPSIPH
jgi:hypothetical protein